MLGVAGDDDLSAVLAHGLLGNLHVIQSVLALLASDRVAVDERPQLHAMAESQIELMVDVLRDMARGLPADVVAFLDSQRTQR